ncbi:intermembrane lipid transfer protein VPS13C-like isoform X2 [Dysidea avara]|uniref:intermembrane lipid transfer protein VPS13C-like isoform X2 n=1 Tax=Dysidea avara TaxID=196820 RepID=UPI00332AA895
MNPVDISADNSIRLIAAVKPLRVTYNATTIDHVISIFKLPKDVHLQQVSTTTVQSLKQLRTQTRTGLQHAISQRRVYDINIKLESPYVVVPENGLLRNSSSVLVADLGCLLVTSDTKHHLPSEESVKNATLEELSEAFYDKFDVKVQNVQIIVAGKGDNWEEARSSGKSKLHVLEKIAVDLQLKKCLLSNDTRLPGMIIDGNLPSLQLSLSDKKLTEIIKIGLSIPVPPSVVEADPNTVTVKGNDLMKEIPSTVDVDGLARRLSTAAAEVTEDDSESDEYATASEGEDDEKKKTTGADKDTTDVQPLPTSTGVLVKMELGRIGISFDHCNKSSEDTPVVSLEINTVKADYRKQTWDDVAVVTVAKISILSHLLDGPPRPFFENEVADTGFVTVNYCKANTSGPQFNTYYRSTKQSINAALALLRVNINEEALPKLISIFQNMGDDISSLLKQKEDKQVKLVEQPKPVPLAGTPVDKEDVTPVQPVVDDKVIELRFEGHFGGFELVLEGKGSSQQQLLQASVTDIDTDVKINSKEIVVMASISDVALQDPDTTSLYHKIVSKSDESEHIVKAKVIVYKEAIEGDAISDLSRANLAVDASVAQLQVIVSFTFVKRIIDFATNLHINHKLLNSASHVATEQVSKAASAIRERNTSRIRLNLTLNAPLIVVPTSTTNDSSEIMVVNLGQLVVRNQFIMGSDYDKETDPSQLVSSTGEPAIMDKLSLSVTSIKAHKLKSIDSIKTKLEKAAILVKLTECATQVTRSLSPWCKPLPLVDVSVHLDTIFVYFSPEVFNAVMKVVESAKVLAVTSSDAIQPADKEDQDKPAEPAEQDKAVEPVDEKSGMGKIKFHATMAGVSLLLNSGERNVAAIKAKKFCVDATLDDAAIAVTTSLRTVQVSDLSHNTLYPLVVNSEGDGDTIFVKVVLHRDTSTQQDTDPDMVVTAEVHRINVAFVYRFISEIQQFVDKLQISNKAVKQAEDTAKETATTTVKAIEKNSMKIKLDVSVRAPQILIPRNSQHKEGFIIDLGHFVVHNSFQIIPETALMEKKAIVDMISVEVTDMTVIRFVIGTLLCKHLHLLEPLTMEVMVERNLSSWYKDVPLVSVNVYLRPVKVHISDDDISMILSVLQHNLEEGKPPKTTVELKEDVQDDVFNKDENSTDTLVEPSETIKDPNTMVTMSVLVEDVKVLLFHKAVPFKVSKIYSWKRNKKIALASIEMTKLKAKLKILTNKTVNVKLSLLNLNIEDIREDGDTERISLMFQNYKAAATPSDTDTKFKMVKVRFIKDEWNQLSLNTKVNYLQVLVNVKFIFMLLDFAKRSIPLREEIENVSALSQQPELPQQQQKTTSSDGTSMNIDIVLNEPRIALLEDASEQNSRVILIKSYLQLILNMKDDKKTIAFIGKDLSISLTRYNALSQPPQSMIMAPCVIQFSLVDTSLDTNGNLEITESVDLTISPATVRLLLHVIQSIPKDETKEDGGENIPESFWNTKALDKNKWYFTAADRLYEAQNAIKESSVDVKKPAITKKENMVITLKMLQIVLEKEIEGSTLPLIVISGRPVNKHYVDSNVAHKDPSVSDHPVYMEVSNWTSKLTAVARIKLRGSYYNENMDVLEPLIEPVEKENYTYHLWELGITVDRLPNLTVEKHRSSSSGEDKDKVLYPADLPPEWSLKIFSEHTLQLTITKTSLELLTGLSKSYLSSVSDEADSTDAMEESQPAAYSIVNKLGDSYPITITPKGNLKLRSGDAKIVIRNKGSTFLEFKNVTKQVLCYSGLDQAVQVVDSVEMMVEGFKPLEMLLTGNRVHYYTLHSLTEDQSAIQYGIVVEIDRNKKTKRVTIQSPVEVHNHLSVACSLYASRNPSPKQQELESLGKVGVDERFPVPLLAAHKGFVFLKPSDKNFYVTSEGIHWNKHVKPVILSCQPLTERSEYFYIRVKPEEQSWLTARNINMEKRPHHVYHLYYPVVFYNMLPIPASVAAHGKDDIQDILECGQHLNMSHVDITKSHKLSVTLTIENQDWVGTVKISEKMDNDDIVTFSSKRVDHKQPDKVFTISVNHDDGFMKLLFYAKYWITNKTNMTLQYTGYGFNTPLNHPSKDEVKFFSMQKKDSKESEVLVRMVLPSNETTKWSRPIPFAAAGSAGTFSVKHEERRYELGVKVQVSRFGLSTIITITPLYVLKNDTKHTLVVQEEGQPDKISVSHGVTIPFWPVDVETCKMSLSVDKNTHKSVPFSVMKTDTVLLRTVGKTTVVVLDIQVTELCKIVTFRPLFSGAIPFMMANHFSYQSIVFKQNDEGITKEYALLPDQSMVFTWDDPCKKREILWWLAGRENDKKMMQITNGHEKFEAKDAPSEDVGGDSVDAPVDGETIDEGRVSSSVDPVDKPSTTVDTGKQPSRGFKKFSIKKHMKKIASKTKKTMLKKKHLQEIRESDDGYWVSFLDGIQRVILFTPDSYVYHISQRPSLVDRVSTRLTASLLALGLSLVDDNESREVAYLGLTGSQIIWEYEKKAGRWVALSQEDVEKLEESFAKFEGKEPIVFPVMIDKDHGADFKKMTWTSGKNEFNLRRTFYEGLWTQVSLSKSETSLSARVGTIQLDNQLFDPIFDNVFHAVPPVDEIARKHPPKPFFDFCAVVGLTEHTGAIQFQYVELLIQKMAFNLDLNFLFAVLSLFTGCIRKDDYSELQLNEQDRDGLKLDLQHVIHSERANLSVPSYFGIFRIHPLSIVLSLNLSYSASDQEKYSLFGPIFNMLRSFGASFISTDDTNLQLSLFTVENKILSQNDMIEKIKQHYIQGGIGQAYKIIFGLDVLGNPVGFVSGLASGTKGLFYEPFEGAILGPEEFLQGVGHGVHDFVGATIGGVADSASRIADTVGSASLALIMTEEEKRKRAALRKGGSILSGLGLFASDLVGTVTDVVSKPVEGAKRGGVTGFFTGAGRGVAGLVLRPIGGTFDLLNVTFDNVKRVTQRGGYEVSQLRPARYIGPDGVVRVYSMHLATGLATFMRLDKYTDTDMYYNHIALKGDPLTFLLITTKRFMVIKKGSLLTRAWQVEWQGIEYSEMRSSVKVDNSTISTQVAVKESGGIGGILGRGITGGSKMKLKQKQLSLPNKDLAKEAAEVINKAMREFTDLQEM